MRLVQLLNLQTLKAERGFGLTTLSALLILLSYPANKPF